MRTSIAYKENLNLFKIWNRTQVDFFKQLMKKIKIDYFKAGKIFAELSDELNRLPNYKEFEDEYEKNN